MKDDKKKIVLSVIGVLVLIVAIFGITYAFWNYVRTGSEDNVITSGKLLINYAEGSNAIDVTDQYPISDAAALQRDGFTFTVSGYATGNQNVNYVVYAVLGDEVSGRNRLKDYEVKIKLTGANNLNVANSIVIDNQYNASYGNVVGNAGVLKSTNSLVLATGFISSHDAGVTETHTYELLMWIPESVVTIEGNTTTTTGNTAGSTTKYSSADYENLYYSMKINVVASSDTVVETNQ